MKVLMIGSDRKIFEPGSDVRQRMTNYAESVEQLTIVIVSPKKFPTQKITNKLEVFSVGRIKAFFWRPKPDFDLITSQDSFEHGLIAWLWSRKIKAKLQLQIHTDFLNPYFARESFLNKIRVRLAKFLLPKADSVRVVSQRIADSLKFGNIRLKQLPIVQPVTIDLEKVKNAPIRTNLHQKYPQFRQIILMASRLTREKNIKLAIMAMNEIVKTKPDIGLIIVGSGPEERKLKNLVEQLNLAENIIFEPWTDDLPSFYKTADLFLLTSFYEGYGRTIVEALACGCPVVSTDVGVAKEVGAKIFPVDEGVALVSKLKEVLFTQHK